MKSIKKQQSGKTLSDFYFSDVAKIYWNRRCIFDKDDQKRLDYREYMVLKIYSVTLKIINYNVILKIKGEKR